MPAKTSIFLPGNIRTGAGEGTNMRVEKRSRDSTGSEVVGVPVRGDIAGLLEQFFLSHISQLGCWGVGDT